MRPYEGGARFQRFLPQTRPPRRYPADDPGRVGLWQGPSSAGKDRGDSFLTNMIRIIMGSMDLVAAGKRDVPWFEGLLEGGQRVDAGPTAPPDGLSSPWWGTPLRHGMFLEGGGLFGYKFNRGHGSHEDPGRSFSSTLKEVTLYVGYGYRDRPGDGQRPRFHEK